MGVVKGQHHTIGPVSYQLISFSFHINQTNNSWELLRNLTLKHPKSRSWVKSKVKVTYCTKHPTDAIPFRFTSIGPTIPETWPKVCLTLKKHIRFFKRKFAKIKVLYRTSPKSHHVIPMTRTKKQPCFVVIWWVILTLSPRQANFCQSMPQPWPWVKVMERSFSTFPQTHIFFVPNI